MLEVVDVSAQIGIDIVVTLKYRQEALLQIFAFRVGLACLGIDGVMTHDKHPLLFSHRECGVEPCHLTVGILEIGIRIGLFVLAILADERGCVDKYHAKRNSCLFVFVAACVVTLVEDPSATLFAIIEHCLRVASVFVIAEHRQPVDHQFGM